MKLRNEVASPRLSELPVVSDGTQLVPLRAPLLRYCEFLTGSRPDAEDLVQTTLLKALRALGTGSHPNLPALLRRIAKNTWIDEVRKQRKARRSSLDELDLPSRSVMSVEQRLDVEAALEVLMQGLTPQQQVVFLLCEVFEYTDREASELLGISKGAVKATLHRAKATLQRIKAHMPTHVDSQASGPSGKRLVDTAVSSGEAEAPVEEAAHRELLQAYVAAFQRADIQELLHLCQVGVLNPVHAVSQLFTLAQRQHPVRSENRSSHPFMRSAA